MHVARIPPPTKVDTSGQAHQRVPPRATSPRTQEDAQQRPDYNDYFRWQIESAVDYSAGSPLVPTLTASLYLQSLHHALPAVCGFHFHRLYPEYEEICSRHGVRLNTRRDHAEAWRTNVQREFYFIVSHYIAFHCSAV